MGQPAVADSGAGVPSPPASPRRARPHPRQRSGTGQDARGMQHRRLAAVPLLAVQRQLRRHGKGC